nr:glycosyltransferase [Chitinophagaceae bacterium]
IVLRLHNVEYKYYRQLYKCSRSILKKLYYFHESMLLKKYESGIAGKVYAIAAMAPQDVNSYRNEFNAKNIVYLPVFSGFERPEPKEGRGSYCLYHGNLSISENEKMAIWLIREVFNDLNIPFLIAGKDPSSRLVRMVNRQKHTCLLANPSNENMQDIISKAQIHILPSLNCTGIKLKLLNALYNGRHCVVNNAAIESTGLEPLCHLAEDPTGFKSIILRLYNVPFSKEDIRFRNRLLTETFDTERNILQLTQLIY